MKKYFDFTLREPKKIESLPQLRERLLKVMLLSSFFIGTVLFAFALIPAIQKGLYFTISIYIVLYIWMILITFVLRVPYQMRSISWPIIFLHPGGCQPFLERLQRGCWPVFLDPHRNGCPDGGFTGRADCSWAKQHYHCRHWLRHCI